jgi:hypothetical protein
VNPFRGSLDAGLYRKVAVDCGTLVVKADGGVGPVWWPGAASLVPRASQEEAFAPGHEGDGGARQAGDTGGKDWGGGE